MKKGKRNIIRALTLLTIVGMSSSVFAANSSAVKDNNNDGIFSGISAAIKQLGIEIQALSIASVKMANNAMYQLDKNLAVAMQANTNSQANNINDITRQNTQAQITNSFREFPEKVVTATQLSDPDMVQDISNRQQLLTNLTTNVPASDTLYLDSVSDPLAAASNVGKPTDNYDNYFNFDSLFAPTEYSASEQQAAKYYLTYATGLYQSLTSDINFSKLKSNLNNLSLDQRAAALRNFVTDPVYQQYQLNVRSNMAAKSIALSNLNWLLSERTPIKGLGAKVGMPDDPRLASGDASPLAVQNYLANQRINNSDWFQQMKTASPATVQREQVLILAEIESQLQRNHLDNERLIAAISMLSLQLSQNGQMMLKTEAQSVNAIIDPNSATTNNTTNNTTTLTPAKK